MNQKQKDLEQAMKDTLKLGDPYDAWKLVQDINHAGPENKPRGLGMVRLFRKLKGLAER